MDKIETILKNIEPIIMNCRKKTNIPSWQLDDYLQEGMIIALEMYHKLYQTHQMMTLTSMFISK